MLELNLSGLKCPLPVLKTKKYLALLASGVRVKIITTDPDSLIDLSEYCNKAGHKVIQQNTLDKIIYTIIEHR